MRGKAPDSKTRTRRFVVRLGLLFLYAGLIALVFIAGKGHTLLLDNKDAEDGSYKAFDDVTVSVDGHEPVELMSGDRDQAAVQGQRHRVLVEVSSEGKKIEKEIRLPVGKEVLLLSVPRLIAGIEPAVTPFVPKDTAPPPNESVGNTNAFTAPGGTTENMMTLPGGDAPAEPAAPTKP